MPHLFVYGTLRRGSKNRLARLLAETARFVGEASVRGQLYDFGRYPGARPANESILGEIFDVDQSLLPILDEYEGPEFQRELVSTSRHIDCWIYWYVGEATGLPIASGDWLHR